MILTTDDILARLISKQPTSLVRVGDGEGIVLNALNDIEALRKCSKSVMERQMGYAPSIQHIEEIRNNLIAAYVGADIIGIPMHKQKTDEHWKAVHTALAKFVPVRTEVVCSIDIHYDFLNAGYYDVLLSYYDRLNYISCRDLDTPFAAKYPHLKQVNRFSIAPESKFVSGYKGEVHYPTQFNKVQRWMQVVHPEGSLLLVGAGVIGKMYCNWWRDMGGVAMDVGSVMDEFAGAVTRGPQRGLDKFTDKGFKL